MVADSSDQMYSENRSGPDTEPWGTSVSRKQDFYGKEPFHVTWKVGFGWYDVNQTKAESEMPSSARVERRIWWLTVSNTEDKSRRMRADDWDEAVAAPSDLLWGGSSQWSDSPEAWLISLEEIVFFKIVGRLVVDCAFQGFREKWKKRYRSVVSDVSWVKCGLL